MIAHQNKALKQLLVTQSVEVQIDSVDLNSPSVPSDSLSGLGSAAIDIRFDPEMDHERTFIDIDGMSDLVWTSSDTHTDDDQAKQSPAPPHTPVAGDSWAALDFILALEWPCREHIKHHSINPETQVTEACDIGVFHGHALTATAAVYSSAQPPPAHNGHNTQAGLTAETIPNQQGLHPDSMQHWQLPHSEIDK